MPDERDITPLGTALENARESLNMSMRDAAKRAKISLTWWRYVVAGGHHQRGTWVEVVPSADAVIAMSKAVGMSVSEALHLAGYEKQANVWRDERVAREVREQLAEAILNQELTVKAAEKIQAALREEGEEAEASEEVEAATPKTGKAKGARRKATYRYRARPAAENAGY